MIRHIRETLLPDKTEQEIAILFLYGVKKVEQSKTDNAKCVKGTEKCEAEQWKKQKIKEMESEE